MITSRVEIPVGASDRAAAVEFQKSLFKEGGPYHNVVKSYRIFEAYFSGQSNRIAVEIDFESLGAFEAAHQEIFSKVTAEEWEEYRKIFNQPQNWSHWIVHEMEG